MTWGDPANESLIDSQHPDIILVMWPCRTGLADPSTLPARYWRCLTTTGGTSENWLQLLAWHTGVPRRRCDQCAGNLGRGTRHAVAWGLGSTVDPCGPIVQSTQEDQGTHAGRAASPRTKTILYGPWCICARS